VSLDPGAEWDLAEERLLALPGIGPWTAAYIRMRALSDPDAFLPGDVGVLSALARLGVLGSGSGVTGPAGRARAARAAAELAESWRPWRSYAVHHLWAYLEEK
jgi:AraC family transcriptional regulator of adaptative response / DNA-3-methyladenine glycosylase II